MIKAQFKDGMEKVIRKVFKVKTYLIWQGC